MLSGGFGGTGGRSNRVDPQLQPLLGVAPLGPIPLSSDRVVQLRMLESSYKHLPQLSDSERVRYGMLIHNSCSVSNGRFLPLLEPVFYSGFITLCNSHKTVKRDPCLIWKVYYIA